MEKIKSCEQCYVYNNIHIHDFVGAKKSEMNMGQNTKHAARKTQKDRQVEKETHDTES